MVNYFAIYLILYPSHVAVALSFFAPNHQMRESFRK